MAKDKSFYSVTNKMIYEDTQDIKNQLTDLTSAVSFHRKWLSALTGAFCTGFIFIIGWMLKIGK